MSSSKEKESRSMAGADLKDLVAVVTGAGSGLGRSIGVGLAGAIGSIV